MELIYQLSKFASQPIPHHLLKALLKDYKRPNDKIHELLSKKIILPLKKGLYITGESIGSNHAPKELIANILYGPSYVSLDYALAYHGIIPESVMQISSLSIKPSKIIRNSLGEFSYTHIPLPYYSYGIKQIKASAFHNYLIAQPEKALCDKIICTSGIQLRSKQDVFALLLEDWRIDESDLKQMDLKQIETWLEEAPKKNSLLVLIDTLKKW